MIYRIDTGGTAYIRYDEDTKMATLRAGKGEHETFISPERLRTFTDIGRELGFDITLFDMTLF